MIIKENMMKKILLLLVLGTFTFTAMMLNASEPISESEYDEDEYGPWDPIVWTKPVKAVTFDHKVHTMDNELDCDSCHDDPFEMEAGLAEENDDFTMQTMYDGGYCGVCHDGETAFSADTRCNACHIGVRGYARMMGESTEKKGDH